MTTNLRKETDQEFHKKILYEHLDMLFDKLEMLNKKSASQKSELQKRDGVSP